MPLSRLVRSFGLIALFVAAALFGIGSGVMFAFVGDLPQISALDDYAPSTITRVLGRDGALVGEFANERRQIVTYDQIPPVLRNAIMSAEDADFFKHSGVDLSRIAVTGVKRILRLQKYGGASTLTQQLARKLFLTDDYSWEQKIKEQLLSIQIEKRYTKQEIFAMYCNKMYFGHLSYGVEAASQLYFAKHVGELTVEEAALIAGILQGNQKQSPYENMPAALRRRNYTLDRMAANGYITVAEADAAKKRPIVTRGQPLRPRSIAPYFVETIRIQIEERYGTKAVYEGGLTVRTGIDTKLQQAANRALDAGLRRLDKLRGFRKPAHNVIAEGKTVESYIEALMAAKNTRWTRNPLEDDVVPAVVSATDAQLIHVRVGRWHGTIDKTGYAWTNRKTADAVVKVGDLIDVRVKKLDAKTFTLAAALEQEPGLQGAVLAIDNHTGQIMTMIGGSNFQQNQFNRATQAMRQVGSLFKPFVYTAAIDRGYTASSTLIDEPVSFPAGPGQPPYEPKNYEKDSYKGAMPLSEALQESRNVPTVRLMNTLGPANVIAYARRMGITAPMQPYLSTAIGASEATLVEMTSAYTAYANQGVRMAPVPILEVTNREGNMLEQHRPEPHEALRADTAYVMTSLLQGVIQKGTGATAATKDLRALEWPLAGKTGTTDDYTDAWFIGFDPDITIGVWIGHDQKKPIGGGNMTGAVAALPIWVDIMTSWVERKRHEGPDLPVFTRPGNVVIVGGEAYISGTEPGR